MPSLRHVVGWCRREVTREGRSPAAATQDDAVWSGGPASRPNPPRRGSDKQDSGTHLESVAMGLVWASRSGLDLCLYELGEESMDGVKCEEEERKVEKRGWDRRR